MTASRALAVLALALCAAGCRSVPTTPTSEAVTRARDLSDQGDVPRALSVLERALQQSPDDPELSIQIGTLERERGNTAEAYVAFRRAVELAPDDVRAISGLALAADALGFREEADAAYADWAELEDR